MTHATNKRPLAAILTLCALVMSLFVSCSQGPEGGTETHWQTDPDYLMSCQSDDECGDLACVRGVCSRACDAPAGPEVCDGIQGAICSMDASPALCTQSCEQDSECAIYNPALTCQQGACLLPVSSENNQPTNNTTPNNTTTNNAAPNNTEASNATSNNSSPLDEGFVWEDVARAGAVVVAGSETLCEFVEGEDARCFGIVNNPGALTPPAGVRLETISMGQAILCGLTEEGQIDNLRCWGEEVEPLPSSAEMVVWEEVSVAARTVCARSNEFRVTCWRGPDTFKPLGSEDIQDIQVGGDVVCGTPFPNGKPVCAPITGMAGSITTPTVDPIGYADSKGELFCAIDANNKVSCWGGDDQGIISALDALGGTLDLALIVGESGCLRSDASVQCWGDELISKFEPVEVPASLAMTSTFACGVLEDGTLTCWGDVASFADEQ